VLILSLGIPTPDTTPAKGTEDSEQDALAAGAIEIDEEEQNKPYTAGAVFNDTETGGCSLKRQVCIYFHELD
jgi:hypothetical protein